MQPVPTAPTAAEDGGLSTHVLHMTRLHAKRPLLVELRVINGPFEGGCRLQSGAGAWLACNTSRVAGPGKRHSARGTPRAQPRDVRSAGRDTWNLTGEALGGPRKRSWRRCSRARSGSRSAIRGAHSGALDRPEPSDPAARAPICTSAPYSAADASGSSCAAGARLR